ncbi:MAG: LysR family transcriptional regulator, partial [Ideonella sp.]|nr:LysR family transcriptional regulator [Ideonella sp.]
EVDRMMTNINLVAAGVGLSLVPASMIGSHAHAVVYRPFADAARLRAPLTLVFRRDRCDGPARTFIELASELAAVDRARGPSPP